MRKGYCWQLLHTRNVNGSVAQRSDDGGPYSSLEAAEATVARVKGYLRADNRVLEIGEAKYTEFDYPDDLVMVDEIRKIE